MKGLTLRRGLFPSVEGWFDDLFGDGDTLFTEWNRVLTTPAVNVVEKDNVYDIEMAVPGMQKKDFSISIENGMLVVKAEQKDEKKEVKENYRRQEFNFHSFKRSFWLPEDVMADKIDAEYENGVLHIVLPKAQAKPEFKRKLIEIK